MNEIQFELCLKTSSRWKLVCEDKDFFQKQTGGKEIKQVSIQLQHNSGLLTGWLFLDFNNLQKMQICKNPNIYCEM